MLNLYMQRFFTGKDFDVKPFVVMFAVSAVTLNRGTASVLMVVNLFSLEAGLTVEMGSITAFVFLSHLQTPLSSCLEKISF